MNLFEKKWLRTEVLAVNGEWRELPSNGTIASFPIYVEKRPFYYPHPEGVQFTWVTASFERIRCVLRYAPWFPWVKTIHRVDLQFDRPIGAKAHTGQGVRWVNLRNRDGLTVGQLLDKLASERRL